MADNRGHATPVFPGPVEIGELLSYSGLFDLPPDRLYDWRGGRQEDDTIHVPWPAYHASFNSFVDALSRLGFVVVFDWPEWDDGRRFVQNPQLINRCDLTDLCKLLTTMVRAERFADGVLASHLEDGLIQRIMSRLRTIDEIVRKGDPEPGSLIRNREGLTALVSESSKANPKPNGQLRSAKVKRLSSPTFGRR